MAPSHRDMEESTKENTGKYIVIVYWISLILFGVYSRMYDSEGYMFGYFFLPLLPFLFVFGLILAAFPHQIGVLIHNMSEINIKGCVILIILAILAVLGGRMSGVFWLIFLAYLYFQLVGKSQENNSEE
ncbi:MAG: Uncharacterised protein [Methanobacteriota archaeon]|nr:MAG: Uncharacterised protein [Euryarchaeota archaeon]